MTIIDELLILLDDLEQAEAKELPQYFENTSLQIIFSSLGRLVNRGWIIKRVKRHETYYTISTHGVNELNRTLEYVKYEYPIPWNKRWSLVLFDIPESKRKLRDSLRLLLKEHCYGMLTSSVWISAWDYSETFKRFSKRHNLNDKIFYLETSEGADSYQSLVIARRAWNWLKIDKAYRNFIETAERELKELDKNSLGRRFKAKKLVFLYAETAKEDPRLPDDISPNSNITRRAYELYAKIRPYCLREEN